MMRNLLTIILALFLPAYGYAQIRPQFTQYIINPYLTNPALSGIENYTDVKISHRVQWVGIADAPTTSYFTIQTPIGKSDTKINATTLYNQYHKNGQVQNYWESHHPSQAHHGVGLQIIGDKAGIFSNYTFCTTYAYHLGLSPKSSLALGVGVELNRASLNGAAANFGNANPQDQAALNNQNINNIHFDLNLGLWLYHAKWFMGVSAFQLTPNKIDYNISTKSPADTLSYFHPMLMTTFGYRTLVGEDFNLIPSIMVRYLSPFTPQVDLNAKLQYRDLLWIGTTFRPQYGYAACLGINVLNTFSVSYSYDYSTTVLNTISKGTHEIVLGFIFGDKSNIIRYPSGNR